MYLTIDNKIIEVKDKGDKLLISMSQYSPMFTSELKSMEGSNYEKYGLWSVKNVPRNWFVLDLLSRGNYNGSSKFYSKFNLSSGVMPRRNILWNHQIENFRQKVMKRRLIDAGEMGIGKTLPTFEAIEYFNKINNIKPWWWIGTGSSIRAVSYQANKFDFSRIAKEIEMAIFTYNGLEERMRRCSEPPQGIVFDEAHALKNSGARRTQLAIQLVIEMEKKWGNNICVFLLTGTPAPHTPFDWWSECEVCRPGWLKEANIYKFKYRLAEWDKEEKADGSTYPVLKEWRQKEIELLPKRLEGLVHVCWKKDCLDLPEKTYTLLELPVSEDIKRVAKILAKGYVGAIRQQKLRELSDGFQYPDDKSGETKTIETPKDEAIKDLLKEHEEIKRIVIYAAYTASVDKIEKICLSEGWEVWKYDGRGSFGGCEEKFQNPNRYPFRLAFVGNPEAAGQGLTLTPASTIVYYSNTFKSQFRIQSEDRIHRPGASKERGCRIIDLIHLPTDKLVLDRIKMNREIETITLEEIEEALK